MKNIETMLSSHPLKPKRPLRSDFTQIVTDNIQSARPTIWQKLHSALPGGLFTKAGIASLAGVAVLGGTAAAFALWPQPVVTPTITKQLPSGNHIVGYDADNCNYFGDLDGSDFKPTSEKLYYEVRKGSSLTSDQLRDSLRAMCEENISNNAISALVKRLPKNLPGMMSTQTYTIDAISEGSITISPDTHYNATMYTTRPNMTYTHFAKDLMVYNQRNKAAFDGLKAGDSIKMIIQDTSGKSTEGKDFYNPLNHPQEISILAIVKVPPLTGDPGTFFAAVGTDLVRVEACDSSPTGFCRAYDFIPTP